MHVMRTEKAQRDVTQTAARLEETLRDLLAAHEQLLSLLDRKREAVRLADADGISSLCVEEHAVIRRVSDMEQERASLLDALNAAFDIAQGDGLTVNDLSESLDQESGARLRVIAARLRDVMQRVKQESAVVRDAAECLSAHLAGIMQLVHGTLSHARVYSRHGCIDPGAPVQGAVDIHS